MPSDVINDIRNKVDIIDIIGERIPLISRGKNFFGVCPFHDDSNPSLCVSREKQIYTCFSCHATGNVYTFLQNYEHWDFKQALKYLGDRVGIDVGIKSVQRKNPKFDRIYQAYHIALKYYQNNLASSYGKEAKKYLAQRKLDDSVIKEFEIGLSLENDDLTKLLIKKGYSLLELNQMGLSSDSRDIYKDRIMFPLYDLNGKPIAFSGRIYQDNNQNKYLNTKETELFKKGNLLYHYHIAKEEARGKKFVLVMEGFMDVIRASTIGIRNTIALMGTALTKEQIKLIRRLSPNIILCLDGDDPGQEATLKAGELFLKEGCEVKVVVLPKEEDPDTFILREGKQKFEDLIENALYFSNYKIQRYKTTKKGQSDKEKAKYINQILKETSALTDEIRIEIILKNLAKEFDIGYNTLEMRFRQMKEEKKKPEFIIPPRKKIPINKYTKAVHALIYFLLTQDFAVQETRMKHLVFPEEKYRMTFNEIFYYYDQYGKLNIADFYTYIEDKEEIRKVIDDVLQEEYENVVTQDVLQDLYKVIQENVKNLEMNRLKDKIKEEMDPIEQAKIAEQIRKLRIGD